MRTFRLPQGLLPMHFSGVLLAALVGMCLGLCAIVLVALPSNITMIFVGASACAVIMLFMQSIKKPLLAIILLEIPFQLDIHLALQEEIANLGGIGGYNVSLTTICLVGLYAVWSLEFLSRVNLHSNFSLLQCVPLVSYLFFVVLSSASASDFEVSLFEITMLAQIFLLFIYIVHSTQSKSDVLFIVAMLLLGLLLQSIIIFGLAITRESFSVVYINGRIDPDGRVGGTIGSPNNAAGYLSMVLAPAFSYIIMSAKRHYQYLAILAFVCGMLALVLTFSRGGWLAFLISITLVYGINVITGRLSLGSVFLLIGIVLIVAFAAHDLSLERVSGDDNGAAYARIPLMNIAFAMIQDHPVFGIGANNFPVALPSYVTPEFSQEFIYTVHNKYLAIWAEGGFMSLMAYLWFLTSILSTGWRCWKKNDPLLSPIALGFAAAVLGHMVHMNVDTFRGRPAAQMLWIVAGLLIAMNNMAEDKQSKGKSKSIRGKSFQLATASRGGSNIV